MPAVKEAYLYVIHRKIQTKKFCLKKCPCSVKVSALHRRYRRMNSFLCSQPYCKTKFTVKKKKKRSLRLFQKLSPHRGASQKVTQVSVSVGQDSIESVRTSKQRVKERSDFRYDIWKKNISKNLRENHTQPWQ